MQPETCIEVKPAHSQLELETARLLYEDDMEYGFQHLVRSWDELPYWKQLSYIVRAVSVIRVAKLIKDKI